MVVALLRYKEKIIPYTLGICASLFFPCAYFCLERKICRGSHGAASAIGAAESRPTLTAASTRFFAHDNGVLGHAEHFEQCRDEFVQVRQHDALLRQMNAADGLGE